MNLPADPHSSVSLSIVELAAWLKAEGYRFVTPTPATHTRVNCRVPDAQARSLRDVFGWSRWFAGDVLPPPIRALLAGAGLLERRGDGRCRSLVRFSSLGDDLYAHSAFPTDQPDAIFFGPDTYRFAGLIEAQLQRQPLRSGARIVDIGCGAGPGGIVAAKCAAPALPELTLTDINASALAFAAANAAHAGVTAALLQGDLYAPLAGDFDLIVSNPPYLNDNAGRLYRHGGGEWGGALSERIVREGVHRLAPGGRLVLYTGVAMVDGRDPFIEALRPPLDALGWDWTYRELDPDVFGEELDEAAYALAERIAAVALVVTRPAA
jgi:SAM-dependent methyltransferase